MTSAIQSVSPGFRLSHAAPGGCGMLVVCCLWGWLLPPTCSRSRNQNIEISGPMSRASTLRRLPDDVFFIRSQKLMKGLTWISSGSKGRRGYADPDRSGQKVQHHRLPSPPVTASPTDHHGHAPHRRAIGRREGFLPKIPGAALEPTSQLCCRLQSAPVHSSPQGRRCPDRGPPSA